MTCSCGKPDCNGKCGKSPAVLQINNPPQLVTFHKVLLPAAMGDDETNPPVPGKYRNVLLEYEANGHLYLYSTDGIPTRLGNGGGGDDAYYDASWIAAALASGTVSREQYEGLAQAIENKNRLVIGVSDGDSFVFFEVTDAMVSSGVITLNVYSVEKEAHSGGWVVIAGTTVKVYDDLSIEGEEFSFNSYDLQQQIDAIVASSDVVDIVGTYAQLQAYDTSKLNDNDIIKVLQDETHDYAISYYRWNKSAHSFSYIGSQGPYYTKTESDQTFVPQTRTINSKPLTGNIVLTAADVGATVYDASWMVGAMSATDEHIDELAFAIENNVPIIVKGILGTKTVTACAKFGNNLTITVVTDTVSDYNGTPYMLSTTDVYVVDRETRAITRESAEIDDYDIRSAIAAKADYGFYGVISGTATAPTSVTTLANGVYKADDTKANSYVSLPMEDETTKRQTLPRGAIAIKTVSRFIVLGTQNLMYQYDSDNQYYYQPDPFIEATIRREAQEGDVSLGQVGSPNVYLVTDPVVSLSATLTTADNQHTRITFTTDSTAEPEDFYLDIDHLDGDPILWQDGKVPTLMPGETWVFEVNGHNIEPLRFSDTVIVDVISYNDLSDKPQITYTGSTVNSRIVTQATVTETVQGTKPIGSYGPFNYIPLDMSSYTSGAANKALLPETHLPSGAYVVTVPGYMRLGSENKLLQAGHIIFWDTDSGELDLIGYNACEYWSYNSGDDTWEGGFFTTSADVEYMIDEKMPNWVKVSSGAFVVANKDPGYYTFNYSSASGTTRRITINVEGTNTYYFPYNDTVLIKSANGVMMLGRFNLWFEHDSTNNYYKKPVPIAQAFTGTDGVNAGTAGLVPAPATTDAGKFLKSDGTWATAGGGGATVEYVNDYLTVNSTTGQYTITQTNAEALRDLVIAHTPLYYREDSNYAGTNAVLPVDAVWDSTSGSNGAVTLHIDGAFGGQMEVVVEPPTAIYVYLGSSSRGHSTGDVAMAYPMASTLYDMAANGGATIDVTTAGDPYYWIIYCTNGIRYFQDAMVEDPGQGDATYKIDQFGTVSRSSVTYDYFQITAYNSGLTTGIYQTVLYNISGTTLTVLPLESSSTIPSDVVYYDTGTATSPTPWVQTSDIVDGAVTADKIDASTFDLEAERVVGTLGGTLVYEKTIHDTPTVSSSNYTISHGITGLSKCISLTGYIDLGTSSLMIPSIGASSSTNFIAPWTVTSTDISLYCGGMATTVTGKTHYITLRYTKSS